MKQFYETYKDNEKLSPPGREIAGRDELGVGGSVRGGRKSEMLLDKGREVSYNM